MRMGQNGGELVNWVTSALVNLCVKERPARLPFILVSSFAPRVLRLPLSFSLIKASPPKISRRDVYLQVPPISRPRSSFRLAFATIVRKGARVTDCNGIPRDTCMHSQLVVQCERRACEREPSSEVEERYVHRSRAMCLLILHDSRVKGAWNSGIFVEFSRDFRR